MANLWDTMDDDQRSQLVRAYVGQQGNRSNENVSRAREQLSNNPQLVQRVAKEEGMIEEDENTVQDGPDEEGTEIERSVAASLEESEGDNQATGEIARPAIPPAEAGESMDEYMARLRSLQSDGEFVAVEGQGPVTPKQKAGRTFADGERFRQMQNGVTMSDDLYAHTPGKEPVRRNRN